MTPNKLSARPPGFVGVSTNACPLENDVHDRRRQSAFNQATGLRQGTRSTALPMCFGAKDQKDSNIRWQAGDVPRLRVIDSLYSLFRLERVHVMHIDW